MPFFDFPPEQLEVYRPPLTQEPDFNDFWQKSLVESSQQPLNAELNPVDYSVKGVKVYRVYYNGFNEARICGWYLVPSSSNPLPALALYHGYGGNKGQICDHLAWALQGFALLAIDIRGQSGESTDPNLYPSGGGPGCMTKGIRDPHEYFYRSVYLDCVRALDFLSSRPEVDPQRIGITGGSQGGGLTLAVAALDSRPRIAMADVPFLCHFRRAVEICGAGPYLELVDYFKRWPHHIETAFRTLSYFDVMNLAPQVQCPTLVSVALMDQICPPSTVYAVYNHLRCPKELKVYPYNGHEGGGSIQTEERIAWAWRFLMEPED